MINTGWIFTATLMVALSYQANAQQNQTITAVPHQTEQITSDYHPDDLAAQASPAAGSGKQDGIQMMDGRPVRLSGDDVPALAIPGEKGRSNNSQKNIPEDNKPR